MRLSGSPRILSKPKGSLGPVDISRVDDEAMIAVARRRPAATVALQHGNRWEILKFVQISSHRRVVRLRRQSRSIHKDAMLPFRIERNNQCAGTVWTRSEKIHCKKVKNKDSVGGLKNQRMVQPRRRSISSSMTILSNHCAIPAIDTYGSFSIKRTKERMSVRITFKFRRSTLTYERWLPTSFTSPNLVYSGANAKNGVFR